MDRWRQLLLLIDFTTAPTVIWFLYCKENPSLLFLPQLVSSCWSTQAQLYTVYNCWWRHPISSQSACVSLVKDTHQHTCTYQRKCAQTTCFFHMTMSSRGGGWERGEGIVVVRRWQGWWLCSGNLTQSCVLGMTSLGDPCRSPAAWELRQGLEGGMKQRERLEWALNPSFICRVMERSKSTAVSQVGPRVKASSDGGRWGWGRDGNGRSGGNLAVGVSEDRAWLMRWVSTLVPHNICWFEQVGAVSVIMIVKDVKNVLPQGWMELHRWLKTVSLVMMIKLGWPYVLF